MWDNAIKIKSNDQGFTFYIPTKKSYENDIAVFFIADYHHGTFYYELHQRNLNNFHTSGEFGLTPGKCEKLFYYLDYSVLSKKDTILLNTIGAHRDAHAQTPAIGHHYPVPNLISVCFWITHEFECDPLPRPAGATMSATEYCYWDEQICIDIDGGGGGGGSGGGETGGGGGGCPWYNPTCSSPPAPTTLNPCQIVDSMAKMHDCSVFLNELRSEVAFDHHETFFLVENPLVPASRWATGIGPENDLSVNFAPPFPVNSVFHNHYNDPKRLSIFSYDDFAKLYELLSNHKIKDAKSFTFGMVADSSSYIMFIDSSQFKSFGDIWLADINGSFESAFFDGYKISPNNTVITNELMFLKAITAFGCGIKLFKGNASMSHFTAIKLNSTATAIEEDTNCNLLPD